VRAVGPVGTHATHITCACTGTCWGAVGSKRAGRQAGWRAGRQAGRLAGRLAGWRTGRQACRQAGGEVHPPCGVVGFLACTQTSHHVTWTRPALVSPPPSPPCSYINGKPFVVRESERPFSNLEYTGIDRQRVEGMEARLKEDVLLEVGGCSGVVRWCVMCDVFCVVWEGWRRAAGGRCSGVVWWGVAVWCGVRGLWEGSVNCCVVCFGVVLCVV
jgi:hypothetical protein